MPFYARSAGPDGRWQPLRDHLLAVGELAAAFAADAGLDPEPARWAGLLHDLGKYSDEFQEHRLRRGSSTGCWRNGSRAPSTSRLASARHIGGQSWMRSGGGWLRGSPASSLQRNWWRPGSTWISPPSGAPWRPSTPSPRRPGIARRWLMVPPSRSSHLPKPTGAACPAHRATAGLRSSRSRPGERRWRVWAAGRAGLWGPWSSLRWQ